ncbi:hypothetical protein D3C80_1931460 [compost metagenome]
MITAPPPDCLTAWTCCAVTVEPAVENCWVVPGKSDCCDAPASTRDSRGNGSIAQRRGSFGR